MLQKEKQAAKATAKGGAKIVSFDLNEGMVGAVSAKASSSKTGTAGEAGADGGDAAAGELDEDIQLITRKALAVKADNINAVFTENITAIADSVNNFQQMEEETVQNDPALLYEKEKENYDREIEKLKSRVEKQTAQAIELTQVASAVSEELAGLEDEKSQYQEQLELVQSEAAAHEQRIEQSSVKGHEIAAVRALIEEKARLAEEKQQLKKKCKEEKKRLDQELERMKQRRADLEQEEHARVLGEIDAEFDAEHSKLLDQRKLVAVENRNINIVQRKIENCPSKIEITQFHKRLVELFDNMNLKAEENRKYINLYNTVQETKRLFGQEKKYLNEINGSYRGCKGKKEKEILKNNIAATLSAIQTNIDKSHKQVAELRADQMKSNKTFNENILAEKEHFKRIKDFEDECDHNDELRAKKKQAAKK